jgi:two-component system, LuxR family, sensor kinase FixL
MPKPTPRRNDRTETDVAPRPENVERFSRTRDQQISLAAEAAKMGFWFRDFGREDFWASEQWRALFGFTSSETLQMDNFFQRLHPSDREPTRQALEDAYRGDGSYQSEHRVVLPDGQVRWIACHGRLELNANNEPLRLLGVSLDVTRRKLAELEAHGRRNEAAHLLRVASLGELSSAMAHELKQPLMAIMSNAQAAQLLLARDNVDLQEIRDILSDIVADDKRAGEVIDRLHGLVRRRDFQPQILEANQLVRDVLDMMSYELTSRSVHVVADLTADHLPIRGDRVQLQQVLINLILNAVDSMSQPPKNERTLTLRTCRVGGNIVHISLADTGHGIPPGNEEAIFDSYYTTKPGGLGLGLSLSRSIVVAHGGHLRAESQGPSGAIFHCSIPESRGDLQAGMATA